MTYQPKPIRSGSVDRSAVRSSAEGFAATATGTALHERPAIRSSIGDFELIRELGSGGMGIVYEARDVAHGSMVAIKTMKSTGAERLMRFKGEFRYTASISHPNLVVLYELGVADGTWFFTMEKVPGVTLDLDLAEHSPTSGPRPKVIADRFAQIVEGLSALHAAGVQHLDLKPANVMVTPEGRVVVLDFGLASLSHGSNLEAESPVLGTVLYMSPEQALGEPTSDASDLYALGAMLYEVLVGRCPHEDESTNAMGLILLKTTKIPPHPRELVSLDPSTEPLADLACRLLAIDPRQRPSVTEVLECLRGDADEVPSLPAAPPFVGRQAELLRFSEILAGRPKDRPTVLHVRGLSGTGKSRLLDRFVGELRRDERNVVFASKCHEYETIPYKGVDGLVDQLVLHLRAMPVEVRSALASNTVAHAATMFPTIFGAVPDLKDPSPVTPDTDTRQLAHSGLVTLLTRVAAERSLFLVLDDVQWSDLGAAQVLASLLRSFRALPCVLIFACRSDEVEQSTVLRELEELRKDASFIEEEIEVGPLTIDAAQELAQAILGNVNKEGARALALEAERIPFFIEQLALHGSREHGRSLAALVRGRYKALKAPARKLLRLAAVAGRPIDQQLLFDAAGVKDGRLEIARLARTSLLRVDGLGTTAKVVTYHDRIREGVIGALDPQTLQVCHGALAEQLLAHPFGRSDLIARHLHGAGADSKAATYAKMAGEQAAAALAFDRAAEHYADALRWGGPEQTAAQQLRCARADALHRAGRCDLAGPAFCEAADLAGDDRRRLELLRLGADAMLSAGAAREAFGVLRPLFREVGVPFPKTRLGALISLAATAFRLRLRIRGESPRQRPTPDEEALFRSELCFSVGKGLMTLASVEGAVTTLRSILYALDAGDARAAASGLLVAGSGFVPFVGARGEDFLDRGLRVANELQDDRLMGTYHVAKGQRAIAGGRWAEAVAHGERAIDLLEQSGEPTSLEVSLARSTISVALEYSGQFRELRAQCQGFVGPKADFLLVSTGVAYTAAAANEQRLLEQVVEDLRETVASFGVDYGLWQFYHRRLELLAMMRRGEIEQALLLFDADWPKIKSAHLMRIPLVCPAVLQVKGALEATALMRNGGRRLRRRVRTTRRQLRKVKRADGPAFAIVLTAVLAAERGDEDEVRASLRAALEAYRRGGQRVCAAVVEWVLALRTENHDSAARLEAELADLAVFHPAAWANFHVPGLVPGGEPGHASPKLQSASVWHASVEHASPHA